MSDDKAPIIIIKKKGGHAAHHGGAWKVAYADFVTAMMALFIVLWLLTQTDQKSKDQIAEYFRTGMLPGGSAIPGERPGTMSEELVKVFPEADGQRAAEEQALNEQAEQLRRSLGKAASDDPDLAKLKEQIGVKVVDDGLLIQIVDDGDDLVFDLSSFTLKPGMTRFLQLAAPILAKLPNSLEVHGHTDARQFDEKAGRDNWDLSFERANQAREILQGAGIPEAQMIGVQAHAASKPLVKDDPNSPKNRRLEILARRRFAREVPTRSSADFFNATGTK